ncbi:MAG: hypothetical protein ACI92I_000147 [Acidimicrobiales bacterium]|jgi:hypothetical protein
MVVLYQKVGGLEMKNDASSKKRRGRIRMMILNCGVDQIVDAVTFRFMHRRSVSDATGSGNYCSTTVTFDADRFLQVNPKHIIFLSEIFWIFL